MDIKIVQSIQQRLAEIETEHKVNILLAIESGSRAWGFESTDSDYDIRFIYKHELSWYLNILPKPDVIEYPIIDLFDYAGWDLKKALFLMNKSNPVLLEWLNSPLVYKKDPVAYEILKKAADDYFSPIASIYHYLHMAKGNYRTYLQTDLVKIKKYFYVLRPLFACLWIKNKNINPPMRFEDMLYNLDLDPMLIKSISELLISKKSGTEMGLEPQIPILNSFIEDHLEYFESYTRAVDLREKPKADYLDHTFYRLLNIGD